MINKKKHNRLSTFSGTVAMVLSEKYDAPNYCFTVWMKMSFIDGSCWLRLRIVALLLRRF